jgi:hypothetical protein
VAGIYPTLTCSLLNLGEELSCQKTSAPERTVSTPRTASLVAAVLNSDPILYPTDWHPSPATNQFMLAMLLYQIAFIKKDIEAIPTL